MTAEEMLRQIHDDLVAMGFCDDDEPISGTDCVDYLCHLYGILSDRFYPD